MVPNPYQDCIPKRATGNEHVDMYSLNLVGNSRKRSRRSNGAVNMRIPDGARLFSCVSEVRLLSTTLSNVNKLHSIIRACTYSFKTESRYQDTTRQQVRHNLLLGKTLSSSPKASTIFNFSTKMYFTQPALVISAFASMALGIIVPTHF